MIEKAADAYRTISEVGEDLDLPQHVLRFWETRFSQIKPLKRGGGRRYYRPDDVELLKGIRHLLYSEGYTIKGVQRILKENGPKAVQALAQEGADEPDTDAMVMDADDDAADVAAGAVGAGHVAAEDLLDYAPVPPQAAPQQRPVSVAIDAAPAVPAWLNTPPQHPVAQVNPAQVTQSIPPVQPYRPPVVEARPVPVVQPPVAPAPPPIPNPAQTVSYTRGGLRPAASPPAQRIEPTLFAQAPATPAPAMHTPAIQTPEIDEPMPLIVRRAKPVPDLFAEQAPQHEEPSAVPVANSEHVLPHHAAGLSEDRRRALQSALFELSECRRAIDKAMAARDH